MSYRIKYFTECQEQCYQTASKELCRHTNFDEFVVESKEACIDVIKDFLDAPLKELTDEEIQNDFGGHNLKLSKQKIKEIQAYYNGRYVLCQKILDKIEKSTGVSKWSQLYSIPEHLNTFRTIDDDEDEFKQIDAYIEIEYETDK